MTAQTATTQLGSLQALRAAAALLVVGYHFALTVQQDFGLTSGNTFRMGESGVDVFFVISGFIMCFTTERADQRSPVQFAIKRLARIVPLYWLLTLLIFGIGVAAPGLLTHGGGSVEQLFKSLFFIPYDRGDGLVNPLLYLGWTLNYEMFFYALFALALLSPRHHILIVVSVIVLLTTIGRFLDSPGVGLAFYTSGIMLDFVWGCVLFLCWRRFPSLIRSLSPLWLLGVALLLAQNFVNFRLPRELEWGLPATLIVAGVLGFDGAPGLIGRFFARIGDASYSLYLGHLYVLETVGRVAIALLGATILAATVAGVASLIIAVGAALLGYSLFERPVSNWLRRRFERPTPPAEPKPLPVV